MRQTLNDERVIDGIRALLYAYAKRRYYAVWDGDNGEYVTLNVPLRCRTIDQADDWLMAGAVARQGDLFFHRAQPEAEGETYTDGGSCHRVTHQQINGLGRHEAETIVLSKSGSVAFIGRRGGVKAHEYRARPRVYMRGDVTHPEHDTITLDGWHLVTGAHGEIIEFDSD